MPNDADRKSKFKICKMDVNFHIKFHEESKNELYFNLRSYPMKAEVKAEENTLNIFLERKNLKRLKY